MVNCCCLYILLLFLSIFVLHVPRYFKSAPSSACGREEVPGLNYQRVTHNIPIVAMLQEPRGQVSMLFSVTLNTN
jgi:hypothetical protein